MNNINPEDIELIKADKEIISKIKFDCGDGDLNEFLLKDSYANIENNLCTIFLCKYQGKIIAFFSLSADSIRVNKKLEVKYREYPAIKIGRLAVHKDYTQRKVGSILIDWIVGYCRNLQNKIGIRYLSVDSYNKEIPIKFYTNNLFIKLKNKDNKKDNIPMYRDLNKKN